MRTLLISFSVLLFLLVSCKPSTDDAIAYNDKIINEQIAVATAIDTLNMYISNKDTVNIKPCYEKLIQSIQFSIYKIDSLNEFDNQAEYKNKIKALLSSYKQITENEYSNLIAICYLPDSLISQDTLNYFNSTLQQINEKFSEQMKEFNTFQESFAKKYNFSLIDKK